MKINECIGCKDFPCLDVIKKSYSIPDVELNAKSISVILVSESAPIDINDGYYSTNDSLFKQTTVQAFNDAGINVRSITAIAKMGVYLTTAVKCAKTEYTLKTKTVDACSQILEKEIELFPNARVILLMGDAAIRSINYISKRTGEGRAIQAGSTYKIRNKEYFFHGKRLFPSYLQAGPSFYIEKSKRNMIVEDIATGLKYASI